MTGRFEASGNGSALSTAPMFAAGGYPILLWGPLHLPPIAPHDAALYALLRTAHTWLALLLFLTILAHLGAALFHALSRRDGGLRAMTF